MVFFFTLDKPSSPLLTMNVILSFCFLFDDLFLYFVKFEFDSLFIELNRFFEQYFRS